MVLRFRNFFYTDKSKHDSVSGDKSHGKDNNTNYPEHSKEDDKVYMCYVSNCTNSEEFENNGEKNSTADDNDKDRSKAPEKMDSKRNEGSDRKVKEDKLDHSVKHDTEKQSYGVIRKQRDAKDKYADDKKQSEKDTDKTQTDQIQKNKDEKDKHESDELHKNATEKVPCIKDGPCDLSLWTNWTACSATCANGTQTRTRELLNCPKGKAAEKCAALNFNETQSCNEGCCPVDCVMGPWTAAGACSVTCGAGQQSMTRAPVSQAICGGQACSTFPTSEVVACNPGTCRKLINVSNFVSSFLATDCC